MLLNRLLVVAAPLMTFVALAAAVAPAFAAAGLPVVAA